MELNEDWFDKTKSTQITLNQILNDNEKVLWKGCPKKSSYALSKSLRLMPMALLWALVDFGIILFLIIVYGNTLQAYMIAILIPFFTASICTCIAATESPPISKKLSLTLILGTFKIFCHICKKSNVK